MPLIARRTRLRSYLARVAIAPFVFIGAALLRRWWIVAICCLGVLAAMILGERFPWPDAETGFAIGGTLVVFWGAAILLSGYDHMRYGGWDVIEDEQPNRLALDFAEAVLQADVEAAYACCTTDFRSRCPIASFEEQLSRAASQLLPASMVLGLDRHDMRLPLNVWNVLVRNRRLLNEIHRPGAAAGLVFFVEPSWSGTGDFCKAIRLLLLLERPMQWRIDTFEVLDAVKI